MSASLQRIYRKELTNYNLEDNLRNLNTKVDRISNRLVRKIDESRIIITNNFDQKLNVTNKRIDILDKRVEKVEVKVDVLTERVDVLSDRVEKVEVKVDVLTERVEKVEVKLDVLTERVEKVEVKLDNLTTEFREFKVEINNKIEESSKNVINSIIEHFTKMQK